MQLIFSALCLLIGWQFLEFYHSCVGASQPPLPRPPSVEAFLPISALMSARFWLQTGAIHPVHPAGLLIFAAIAAVSFLFKRAFCSWICPFGLLSEKLADIGRKIIGRNPTLPRWADWPMRALKYLLLGFFVDVIFRRMDLPSLGAFLDSPFNQTADVRLLLFFLHPGTTTILILAILIGLSLLVRHFWCRYLCPYGALTALAGLVSPTHISRHIPSCIECAKCAKVCPARLPVDRLRHVRSDECSLCLECVEACPVPNTLGINVALTRRRIPSWILPSVVGAIFLLAIIWGKLSGHWQSSVPSQQIAEQIQSVAPRQP
jgi:polyferredoxin